MEILLAALKSRGIKLPKFLLWKIAREAYLELNYSRELAEYFYNEKTFGMAILRKKKLAITMAATMSDYKLQVYDRPILKSGLAPLILRISNYLVVCYNYDVFDYAAITGNVSLLHALCQKHSNMTPKFSLELAEELFRRKMTAMLEYLLDTNRLTHQTFMAFNFVELVNDSSEEVIRTIAVGLSRREIADFLQSAKDCPHLATILRRYL